MNRIAALLVSLAFSVGCAQSSADRLEAIRLSDLADAATVAWPKGLRGPLPEGVEGLRTYRQLKKRRLGRVAMFPESGGEDRQALLAPPGTKYTFSVEVRRGAALRVGFGYVPPATNGGADLRFVVSVALRGSTEETILLDRAVTYRTDGGWKDVELDLSAWTGETVDLSLATSGAGDVAPVLAAWSAPEIVSRTEAESRWDVVLIVLDTLRADRLGCYGYERAISPNLDRMASEGVRFATAVSQAPWTRPSHQALFSSLFPTTTKLARWPVLAEVLHEAGYRTEAVTGGGQMDFRMGFGRGFETYRVFDWIRNLDEVELWLERSRGRGRFLFLHTYEIHDPYIHAELATEGAGGRAEGYFDKHLWFKLREELTDGEKAYVRDLYDGGIAYTDRQLGRLFELFEAGGVFDRSIVIITSDHGEQFWEHGTWRHGMSLHDHQLLVPLVIRLPDGLKRTLSSVAALSGRVIEDQVRLVDLYPTILDLLDLSIQHRIDGRSLRPLFEGGALAPVDAFAERLNVVHRESKALRSGRYKYIYSYPRKRGREQGREESRELFDLARDPLEQENLAERYPEQVAELDARLRALLTLLADPSELEEQIQELDPDLERRLRALGYLGN